MPIAINWDFGKSSDRVNRTRMPKVGTSRRHGDSQAIPIVNLRKTSSFRQVPLPDPSERVANPEVTKCYVTAIKLRKKSPSPAGEGRGEENKNKENALFDALILTFSLWKKGLTLRYPHEFSKLVVPAGMPESSAMPVLSAVEGDGNFMTFQVFNKNGCSLKFHILVAGCWHPCQHDDFPSMLRILTAHKINNVLFYKIIS